MLSNKHDMNTYSFIPFYPKAKITLSVRINYSIFKEKLLNDFIMCPVVLFAFCFIFFVFIHALSFVAFSQNYLAPRFASAFKLKQHKN